MDAIGIFKEAIGSRLNPLIVQYDVYADRFETYPFRHSFDENFEKQFSDVLFDSIIFYAYEKDEIENDSDNNRKLYIELLISVADIEIELITDSFMLVSNPKSEKANTIIAIYSCKYASD